MTNDKHYKYLSYQNLRYGLVQSLSRFIESGRLEDLRLASALANEAVKRCPIDPCVRVCQARIMEYLHVKTGKDYFAEAAEYHLGVARMTKSLSESTKEDPSLV